MDPRLIRKVRRRDRMASWIITAGGLSVIVCVLGILVLIGRVALPLFQAPELQLTAHPPLGDVDRSPVLAIGLDEQRAIVFTLRASGALAFLDARDGRLLQREVLRAPGGASGGTAAATAPVTLQQVQPFGDMRYSLLWSDGALSVVRVRFRLAFDADGVRSIVPSVEPLAAQAAPADGPPLLSDGRADADGGMVRASLRADGTIRLDAQVVTTTLLGTTSSEEVSSTLQPGAPGRITHLLLSGNGQTLYAASDAGFLLRWDLREPAEPRLLDRLQAFSDGRAITALGLLLGEVTLVVGDELGEVSGWFPLRSGETGTPRLTLVHRLGAVGRPIVALAPSLRAKSVLALDADGSLHAYQLTDEKELFTLAAGQPLRQIALNSRANGLVGLDAQAQVWVWDVAMPHPEVSGATYFSPLWYESYPAPAYVWQSSAGSDDFEPKLSLVPLIVGTLKGTFYGMLFAAPLGVLGAMYTSSLMHPRLRGVIKPAFEIMGSIPTVVIGFLAALWLAPLVKGSLTAFFLMLGVLPLTVIGAMALYEWAQTRRLLPRAVRGYEFLLMLPAVLVGLGSAFVLGWVLDAFVLGGGLPEWLFAHFDVRIDQRNSIIIAFAMGFAVLPVVFSISDDALVNVPRNLTAASLALGASRWQTVARVILPSASPGIFAALMVGFGRAVGETMIVLMATGNTPIMDWSPFNGMRTLAANIAVEIPEAPVGGTLYRTLFLSAVLLFITTFVLNSVAEVVRIRLRRKFGQY